MYIFVDISIEITVFNIVLVFSLPSILQRLGQVWDEISKTCLGILFIIMVVMH